MSLVADYFVTVGAQDPNELVIGSDMYAAVVLDRYPPQETSPFPNGLAMFCFPEGGIAVTDRMEMPKFFEFVTTGGHGTHLFGFVLLMYEPMKDGWYTPQMKSQGKLLYLPKALCVLSQFPFRSQFRQFLTQLYRISLSPVVLPLERLISNFISEVPMPPAGKIRVLYQIGDLEINFTRPAPNNPLSWTDIAFQEVFECLSLENILMVLSAVLTERQIIIRSTQHSLLSALSEVIRVLIYPFIWDHVYIPVLPLQLVMVLQAPLPFIIGVHDTTFRLSKEQGTWQVSPTAVIVNMDNNRVSASGPEFEVIPLPDSKKLLTRLQLCAPVFANRPAHWVDDVLPTMDCAIQHSARPYEIDESSLLEYQRILQMEDTHTDASVYKTLVDGSANWFLVRTAFFRFFISVLRDYRDFLVYPEQKPQQKKGLGVSQEQREKALGSFNSAGFLAKRKKHEKLFMSYLVQTQHFSCFIDCHLHPDGERDTDVVFFEQSIEAKYNRNLFTKLIPGMKVDTPFLDDRRYAVTKTVVTVSPDNSPVVSLREDEWMPANRSRGFEEFPRLLEPLFGAIRTLPEMPHGAFKAKGKGFAVNTLNRLESKPACASDTVYGIWFMLYGFSIGKVTPYSIGWESYEGKFGKLDQFLSDSMSEATLSDQEDELLLSSDDEGMMEPKPVVKVKKPRRSSTNKSRPSSGSSKMGRRSSVQFKIPSFIPDTETDRIETTYRQLDLAFDILDVCKFQSRKVTELVFRALIDACGRCGHIDYAIQILGMMHQMGLKPDSQVYSNLVQSFSMNGDVNQSLKLDILNWETLKQEVAAANRRIQEARSNSITTIKSNVSSPTTLPHTPPAAVRRSWQKWGGKSAANGSGDTQRWVARGDTLPQSQSFGSSFKSTSNMSDRAKGLFQSISMFSLNGNSSTKKEGKGFFREIQRRDSVPTIFDDPECLTIENPLNMKLLEELLPELMIDIDRESCPKCQFQMSGENIRMGWGRDPNDYTTTCPKCQRKFVAFFTVKTSLSDWTGSRGIGTELFCEFLPPWTLEKEVRSIMLNNHASFVCSRHLRLAKPTVFWNLVIYFKELNLPLSFLLGPPIKALNEKRESFGSGEIQSRIKNIPCKLHVGIPKLLGLAKRLSSGSELDDAIERRLSQ